MGRILAAASVFYPAAAAYAAVVLPLSVLAMAGYASAPAALADPLGHAHEMLLGFALAVIAGNQLGSVRPARVLGLAALWVAARIAFVAAPQSTVATILDAGFAALLALQVVPRLFGAAKKARNLALPATLAALCLGAIAWSIAREGFAASMLLAMVMLLAALMLFMGGRIIAPTVAGQMYRQGGSLEARVQPRLEAALMIASALAVAAALVPGGELAAAAACAAAAILAAIRIARWRPWRLRGRADLLCLAAGYGWLALGLAALAAALASGRHASAAIHVITVGALGTLTLNVMALTWRLRARRAGEPCPALTWATLLVAFATLSRVAAAFAADPRPWLGAAALAWSAAFLILLAIFHAFRR